MLKTYKYRLYPNKKQRIYFDKTFGCVRFVYNKMLSDRIKAYNENKKVKHPTPAQYKEEFQWLKEVDALALCNAQMNLDRAYTNYFRDNAVGFPKFKSKKGNRPTYTTNNLITHNKKWDKSNIRIEGNKIRLTKIGFVKLKQHRKFNGIIKHCTITRTPSDKYFIAVLVDTESFQFPKNENKIGIDLGIKEFAITSDGEMIPNPKHLMKSEKKLAKLQRRLSRKQLHSNNRNKARLKVARVHEKITNQRNDFLQKLSTRLINENQVIVIEDLSIKSMLQNHRLAKSINNVSWARFRTMLEYKAIWYGKEIIIAPWNYASSQLCSRCGNKSKQTKDLKCRTYICPVCGLIIDRDINASLNLLKLAE